MPSISILALVAAAAVGGLASPHQRRAAPFNVDLKYYHSGANMADIVRHDRARIEAMNSKSKSKSGSSAHSGSVTNVVDTYLAAVKIGGKTWNLLVDTGCAFPHPQT